MVLERKRGKEMGYLGNKLQGKYHKDTFQTAVNMAWPAIVESFFIAFAGLVDSLMVSCKLAWLLRSCRGRSDDTAEAAWPGVFLCAECVDFGSRCAAARRAEAGCGE